MDGGSDNDAFYHNNSGATYDSGTHDLIVYQDVAAADLGFIRSRDSLVIYSTADAADGNLSNYAMLSDWFTSSDHVEYLQDGNDQIFDLSVFRA
ncbi:hypothetical protein ABLO27_12855 [Roseibium sp. SCPC15]|uniref:hypothetical protein n=1 Tax=Roseibium sp. SCP15 TaxID=3141376 RepID=UPI00333AC48C